MILTPITRFDNYSRTNKRIVLLSDWLSLAAGQRRKIELVIRLLFTTMGKNPEERRETSVHRNYVAQRENTSCCDLLAIMERHALIV